MRLENKSDDEWLRIRFSGRLVGGSVKCRVIGESNGDIDPEYLLGEMSKQAGLDLGDRGEYELAVKKKVS